MAMATACWLARRAPRLLVCLALGVLAFDVEATERPIWGIMTEPGSGGNYSLINSGKAWLRS